MSGIEDAHEVEDGTNDETDDGPPVTIFDHIHLFEIFDNQHNIEVEPANFEQPELELDDGAILNYELSASSLSEFDLILRGSRRDFAKFLASKGVQKLVFVAVFYPVRFARTLVQLGYIPKEIASNATVGGVNMYGIPSIFEYMKYIKTAEGMSGMVRGEISYCCSVVLYGLVNFYTTYHLTKTRARKTPPPTPPTLYHVCSDIWWTTATSSAVAVMVSHPLAVLSLRQLSQFIGKENIYSNVSGLKNLLLQPGMFALLDGIIPRYIYLMVPALTGKIAVAVYEHYVEMNWPSPPYTGSDIVASVFYTRLDWVKKLIGLVAVNYVSDVLYPMDVVFVASSVAHSGVVPGEQPFAANAASWVSRLVYMAKHHQLWRRASFLNRVFTEHSDAFIVY